MVRTVFPWVVRTPKKNVRGSRFAKKHEYAPRVNIREHSRVNCVPDYVSTTNTEIQVLVGGAILPPPVVPSNTTISARLKRVKEHVSPVSMVTCVPLNTASWLPTETMF